MALAPPLPNSQPVSNFFNIQTSSITNMKWSCAPQYFFSEEYNIAVHKDAKTYSIHPIWLWHALYAIW